MLITLGIIGVVAAMTIPTLIHNYKKKEIETKIKRIYSLMNQAVGLSIANGTWTNPPTDKYRDDEALQKWLNTALFPYIKIEECERKNTCPKLSEYSNRVSLPDGSCMAFGNITRVHVVYTLNCSITSDTVKYGADTFNFFLSTDNPANLGYFYPSGYALGYKDDEAIENNQVSDIYVYDSDRETIKKYCTPNYKQNTNITGTCALLIMKDGWKIADDYPIKF